MDALTPKVAAPTEEFRELCGEAAHRVQNLQTRLRTLVAAADPRPEHLLLADAMTTWLGIAHALLDAGRRGHHARILALRPFMRALARTGEHPGY